VELQHLLFHKFQQASGDILTRDNTQSTGWGLYISRLLAESMQGTLYLEHSEIGKGSTFVLELPLENPA
jgi:signal transduction histidine kinase